MPGSARSVGRPGRHAGVSSVSSVSGRRARQDAIMPIPRAVSLQIRNGLDNWLPASLRDSRLVMGPLLRLALGRHAAEFMAFKRVAFAMTPADFADVYRRLAGS